jgi:hypothetical protein
LVLRLIHILYFILNPEIATKKSLSECFLTIN